mgnify:CR=1 FL=1
MSTREKAAKAAANLSGSDKEIGLLVQELETKEGIEQLRAIAYLADKTGSESERKDMGKESLGLLKTLAKVIRGDNFDCRLGAIGIVWKLSIEDDNRMEIIKPDVGLLDAIMFALQDGDRPEPRSKGLGAMHNLTLASEAQEAVAANSDWLRVFVDLLHHDSTDIKDRSVGVLWNLATLGDNRVKLVNTPDLLPAVSSLLVATDTGDVDVAGKALVVLYYLTLVQESRVKIAAAEGLLPNIVSYLKHPDLPDDSKFKLASMIINLSSAPENKKLLGDPDLGLVEVLVDIVTTGTNMDLKNKSCGCLWNLSVAAENRQYLASEEVGLLSALMTTLTMSIDSPSSDPAELKTMDEVVTKTCVIIQNLAGDSANHTLMVDPELKLISTLAKIILSKQGDVKLKAFGAIVNLSLSQNTQAAIGEAEGCLKALLSVLTDSAAGDYRARAAGVLQNLAVDAGNRTQMGSDKDLNLVATVIDIIANPPPGLLAASLGLLLNLSVANENKTAIGESEKLTGAIIKVISTEQPAIKVKALSLVWSLSSDKVSRTLMKASTELIDALSVCATEEGEVAAKALGALGNLAPDLKPGAA